jgi:hypothetical protein
MDYVPIPEYILNLYTTTGIAGYRISRMEESFLGMFRLTAETAWTLGTANVGVFVGGGPALGKTIERLKGLERPDAAKWVVVAATKKMAAVIADRWFQAESGNRVVPSTLILPRYHRNIILCTPESLHRVEANEQRSIAAIILIDMLCNVHKARGFERGNFHIANDRPQLVANFRNSLLRDGWAPPLIVLTQKPAKSVWIDPLVRAYCLDDLWFVDGSGLTSFAADSELAEQCVH